MNSGEASWNLCLLGKAELRDGDGAVVQLLTRKVLQLLAFLSLHSGEELARAQLAETIWTDADSKGARDSLRTALANLRSKLPAGAIEATPETVTLCAGFINCDAFGAVELESYAGDFMPGHDQDWIIEHRLHLRSVLCSDLLSQARAAWSSGDRQVAIELAIRACEVEPFSQEAAQTRVQFLEVDGKGSEATRVADAFRVKSLRELGVISDVRPAAKPEDLHPLATAAEWVLDRNPEAALEMLAATHSEWLTMPVELALDLHRRALRSTSKESHARKLVNAQTVYLFVLAGRLGTRIGRAEAAYQSAVETGDGLVAARLSGALAYGYLSRGEFEKSLFFAKRSVASAEATKKPIIEAEFEQLLGIIQGQVGFTELGMATHAGCTAKVETFGTPQMIASQNLLLLDALIKQGKIEQAVQNHENAKRINEACGANRMQCWVQFGEVVLNMAVGDNIKAKTMLEDIRKLGSAFGGHSITAMAEDWMACIDCNLGELETAAEAFARASAYRKTLGTVQSVSERSHVRPARKMLKERLGIKTLRAAYLKAAENQMAAGHLI